jgi:hypothetical protein
MDLSDTYGARDLPDQIAIMVVDAKAFSKHDDLQQDELVVAIPRVLEAACRRAELPELWAEKRFPDSTGDGFIIGFPPRLLARVVNRYIECLQIELRLAARTLPAGARLRMRMSLNVGPVSLLNEALIDSPVGATMIDTHRLVDAAALRVLLDRSDPDITHLVAALSERVIEDTVRSGRAGRRLSEFVKAPVEIKAKDFCGTAYLRVPAPSGEVLALGVLGVQPLADEDSENRSEPGPEPIDAGDIDGSIGVLGEVSGNQNTIAGRDLDQSSAGRDAYRNQGDMNFGSYSGQRGDRTGSER